MVVVIRVTRLIPMQMLAGLIWLVFYMLAYLFDYLNGARLNLKCFSINPDGWLSQMQVGLRKRAGFGWRQPYSCLWFNTALNL